MAERNYLSIGQVVNLLRGAYPDLSNSKIRFLEDEGLITPHRTPKGYRQYSKEDVDRLEVILHLQKTKEALMSSENNLRLANNKAQDLTIKRLTRNNPTMKAAFEALAEEKDDTQP